MLTMSCSILNWSLTTISEHWMAMRACSPVIWENDGATLKEVMLDISQQRKKRMVPNDLV
jgi:hypothetical protein